jgi:hypothetical protein
MVFVAVLNCWAQNPDDTAFVCAAVMRRIGWHGAAVVQWNVLHHGVAQTQGCDSSRSKPSEPANDNEWSGCDTNRHNGTGDGALEHTEIVNFCLFQWFLLGNSTDAHL